MTTSSVFSGLQRCPERHRTASWIPQLWLEKFWRSVSSGCWAIYGVELRSISVEINKSRPTCIVTDNRGLGCRLTMKRLVHRTGGGRFLNYRGSLQTLRLPIVWMLCKDVGLLLGVLKPQLSWCFLSQRVLSLHLYQPIYNISEPFYFGLSLSVHLSSYLHVPIRLFILSSLYLSKVNLLVISSANGNQPALWCTEAADIWSWESLLEVSALFSFLMDQGAQKRSKKKGKASFMQNVHEVSPGCLLPKELRSSGRGCGGCGDPAFLFFSWGIEAAKFKVSCRLYTTYDWLLTDL